MKKFDESMMNISDDAVTEDESEAEKDAENDAEGEKEVKEVRLASTAG
jgi:hypothetical protein